VLLFGAMIDKDAAGILASLAPHVAAVVATKPRVLRAADDWQIAATAHALGLAAEIEADPACALEKARALAGPSGLVLVSGSLYLVGEVSALLSGRAAPGPVAM